MCYMYLPLVKLALKSYMCVLHVPALVKLAKPEELFTNVCYMYRLLVKVSLAYLPL